MVENETKKVISEKEIEDFIKADIKKDITQDDKIEESVEQHLQEMGFLWDRMQTKFHIDKTCFDCKEEMDMTKTKLHVIEASNVEKGVVAFVSICGKCYTKQRNKIEGEKKNEKRGK